ncbi:MAG: methyl-accepting chemotaxis protein [Clostridiales bacterium]|nr:methyl-accepting chemotaxis protein [Clostridiales bacterium]
MGSMGKNTSTNSEKKKSGTSDTGKSNALFSLRNKIYICFLIPIIFMIAVGFISYYYAQDGLSDKFKESAIQTSNMAMQYMDTSCTYIQSEGLRYAFDSGIEDYSLGMPGKSTGEKTTYFSDARRMVMASQSANPFISNLHIVPKAGNWIISSSSAEYYDGIYDEYYEEMLKLAPDGGTIPRWIDSHPLLNGQMGLSDDDYFMAYQMQTSKKFAYVVVDVKTDALANILNDMDFGEGSIRGFVTDSGKELIVESKADGQMELLANGESVFSQQDFYTQSLMQSLDSGELSGVMDVTYLGEKYLYVYSRSEVCNVTLCSLIPLGIVTGQAETIKTITITLVILAAIIAIVIGTVITMGIQKNMKSISHNLNEVAKGDLTVKVKAQGKDEFQSLAQTATNMIKNNKKLVLRLTDTIGQLEKTAEDVNGASDDISEYSKDIVTAINEISAGMSKQAGHAQECVVKTNGLSKRMGDISTLVQQTENLADETGQMVNQGMEIVGVLGERAKKTTDITANVGSSIEMLKTESEMINGFVETISDISGQTNLLSLNASIEAARAGEAGRGFAIVAEEIRKLADESNAAAEEIRNNVNKISAQTMLSVNSAKEAEAMVALQAETVDEVISVFRNIEKQISNLLANMKAIANSTELADSERDDTIAAVENISSIIEQTAGNSEQVHNMAIQLRDSIQKLDKTAQTLDDNMSGLKTEISVFKLEK